MDFGCTECRRILRMILMLNEYAIVNFTAGTELFSQADKKLSLVDGHVAFPTSLSDFN